MWNANWKQMQTPSSQDHYDFGMRAVKSVLVMAGALRRAAPGLPEDVVLIRCGVRLAANATRFAEALLAVAPRRPGAPGRWAEPAHRRWHLNGQQPLLRSPPRSAQGDA